MIKQAALALCLACVAPIAFATSGHYQTPLSQWSSFVGTNITNGGRNDTALGLATLAVGTIEADLVLDNGTWAIDNHFTFGPNIQLTIPLRSGFNVGVSNTLTFNSTKFIAPPTSIFAGHSAGAVTGCVDCVVSHHAEWSAGYSGAYYLTNCVARVGGDDIADNSITSAHIVDRTIVGVDIATNTITGANILDGTITGVDIATNTITGDHIVDGTILGTDIATNTITTNNLAFLIGEGIEDGSISTSKIDTVFHHLIDKKYAFHVSVTDTNFNPAMDFTTAFTRYKVTFNSERYDECGVYDSTDSATHGYRPGVLGWYMLGATVRVDGWVSDATTVGSYMWLEIEEWSSGVHNDPALVFPGGVVALTNNVYVSSGIVRDRKGDASPNLALSVQSLVECTDTNQLFTISVVGTKSTDALVNSEPTKAYFWGYLFKRM
jgi:hypothetical protein